MIKLRLLGPSELRNIEGNLEQSFISGPKRLGLLAYLALSRPQGYTRRDRLLPIFWPNQGQSSARNALSNMLYHLRQSMGKNFVINRGKEEIELGAFWCDVHSFEGAVVQKNLKKALDYYRGPLLEGLHIPSASSEFQHWLDNERQQLKKSYCHILKSLANKAEKQADYEEAVKWWQKLNKENPYDSNAFRRHIEALMADNKKSEALRLAREHTTLLEQEFGESEAKKFNTLSKEIVNNQSFWNPLRKTQPRIKDLNPLAIAVLPFKNINKNEDIDSFAIGIHNDLLSGLSNISTLSVTARTSVRQYKDDSTSLQKIAQKLGVGTILEGNVQNTKKQVRLHIQMTDARNDQLLWADTYDRKLTATNLFDIQSELSKKIVRTLKTKLTAQERERIIEMPTENLEAYHLYVQGRTHLAQRTQSSILRAISYFKQASNHDPNYSLAWAGLSEALVLLEFYNYTIPKDQPDTMEVALKALELNPSLSEAHTSMGILYAVRKNGPAALNELQKAIELKPSNAEAYNWLGWIYLILGGLDKAGPPAERAAELDPMAPYVRLYLGKIYLAKGEYKKALYETRSARQLQPDLALTHLMEGLSLYHLNRFAEALFALNEAITLSDPEGIPKKSEIIASQILTLIASNDNSKAQELFQELKEMEDYFSKGLVYATLGKPKKALQAFKKVKDWGYFSTAYIRYFFPSILDPLRNKSSFKKILDKVNESWIKEE